MTDPAKAVGVVVVTYHPDERVMENLRTIVAEFGHAWVVDNGSGPDACAQISSISGVELIALDRNHGLAAALNRGIRKVVAAGGRWAVTFDQDSRPEPGMLAALWRGHVRLSHAGVIGPRVEESGSGRTRYRPVCRHPRWPLCFSRPAVTHDLDDVTMVITSGSLIDLALWQELGGFDDGLFIDYIDIDYCLKVGRSGRGVAVAGEAVLHHRIGNREERLLMGRDFRPMHHAAFRHYFMARNRVIVWRRHALAVPHWALFDLCFAIYNGSRMLAFERDRLRKTKAIVLGTWDGLLGRRGPLPGNRKTLAP